MTKTVSVTSQTTISMTKTVSVTSQTSIETTVVTSIGTSVQNSGVSFSLSLPFANSVDNGSNSVVGSIGPSVSVKGSNLDGSSMVTVVTATIPVSMTKTVSVTSQTTISMTKTVSVTSQTSIETTVVTSIGTSVQNSGVSFGF